VQETHTKSYGTPLPTQVLQAHTHTHTHKHAYTHAHTHTHLEVVNKVVHVAAGGEGVLLDGGLHGALWHPLMVHAKVACNQV